MTHWLNGLEMSIETNGGNTHMKHIGYIYLVSLPLAKIIYTHIYIYSLLLFYKHKYDQI